MNRNTTAGLVVLALALAACSMAAAQPSAVTPTPTPPPSSTPAPTPSPTASPTPSPAPSDPAGIEGRDFNSVGVRDGDPDRQLVPGTTIRLGFRDGRISVNAGCNTMGGTYRLDGAQLIISNGAVTEIGCDQDLQAQDEWLFAFLGSNPTIALNGNDLVLTSGATVITMLDREVADPDQPLTGRVWALNSVISGESVSSVPTGVTATIKFNDDGSVEIHPGCNSGGGQFTVGEGVLRFSNLVTTKMACGGDGGSVEASVLAVLSADQVTYEIDAGVLTLQAGDQGLGFTAP